VNDVSESPAARASREAALKSSPLVLLVPAVIAIVVAAVIALAFTKDDDTEAASPDVESDSVEAGEDSDGSSGGVPVDPVVDAQDMPEIAVQYGGAELSGADLLAITTEVTGGPPTPQMLADQVTTWLLVEAVTDVLAERGVEITDEDRAASREAAIAAGVPSDTFAFDSAVELQTVVGKLNDYARENAELGESTTELICSSHILLQSEEEAFAAIGRLDSGEAFADVAIDVSTGPSGPSGGQLGCVDTTTFVAEYVDGARANGVGVTDPVESQFGFHVIEVRYLGPLAEDIDPTFTPEQFAALSGAELQAAASALNSEIVAQASEAVAADHFIDPSIGTWLFPPGSVQAPPAAG